MKWYVPIWTALAACALMASQALAYQPQLEDPSPPRALDEEDADDGDDKPAYLDESYDDVLQPDCYCEEPAADASCAAEEPACGFEPGCECEGGCTSGCDGCDLGDAWTLQSYLTPCCDSPTYGGWFQMGYHSDNTGQSSQTGDLLDFNDVPDRLRLHQAWVYTEKLAEADACSADWGYRFDILYGTDAQKTQAFGNTGAPNAQGWDNDWDHGVYGWAIPQLYGEIGYGDWSVKVGHFFTPLGYEVIPATGNFFYSHALTMFNSEPFTHTGVLGTYKGYDNATVYAGWTLGWDTGYDQFGDGNSWLGGMTYEMSDNLSVTYLSTAGNFGFRSGDEPGYSHSIVLAADLTDSWKYVFQSDYVRTAGSFGDPDAEGEDVGVNQYLFYTINDCWSVGGRAEWWKSNVAPFNPGESTSYYEITGGINYRPHANIVFRPEIRYDWSPTDFDDPDYNRTIFGIDMVCTF